MWVWIVCRFLFSLCWTCPKCILPVGLCHLRWDLSLFNPLVNKQSGKLMDLQINPSVLINHFLCRYVCYLTKLFMHILFSFWITHWLLISPTSGSVAKFKHSSKVAKTWSMCVTCTSWKLLAAQLSWAYQQMPKLHLHDPPTVLLPDAVAMSASSPRRS